MFIGDGQVCDGSVASLAHIVGNNGDLSLVKRSKAPFLKEIIFVFVTYSLICKGFFVLSVLICSLK